MNLLQSAGFSKSNPYYIVPQGRITALTNARDSDRLQLLKEVAGTRVYEEHREESLKIMRETEAKREKIIELLASIKDRLAELESERGELDEFVALEKDRKACEHVLYTRDLEKASAGLARLEAEFKTVVETEGRMAEAGEEQLVQVQRLESELDALKRSLVSLSAEQSQLQDDKDALEAQRTQLELAAADLDVDAMRFAGEESRITSVLEDVEAEISAKEGELGQLAPQVTALEAQERETRANLSSVSQRRQALQAKRGRLGQFRSESDRNRWLTKEIEAAHQLSLLDIAQRSNLTEEVDSYAIREADLAQEIREVEDSDPAAQLQLLDMEYNEARRARDGATETRKELWRAQAKLEASLGGVKDELDRLVKTAAATPSDKSALSAVQVVMRLAARSGLSEQCHGPLHSLFQLTDPLFMAAVDEVGGGSLFHVVVDDDQVASRLMEALGREGAGRVTFMPLNRLRSESAAPMETDDAVPLLSRLTYDPRFAPAMQHVFGRTLVCKDLPTAARLARELRLDAITLAGDRASRKGALTGGSAPSKKGSYRLEALWRLGEWTAKKAEMEDTLFQVKDRIMLADQQVTTVLGRMQLIECQRQDAKIAATRGSPAVRLQSMRTELASLQEILASKRTAIARLEESIAASGHKVSALQSEQASPFVNALSPEESTALAQLSSEFDRLSAEYATRSAELSRLLQSQGALEAELEGNLRRRRHALLAQRAQVSTAAARGRAESLAQEIEVASQKIRDLDAQIAGKKKELAATQKEEAALQSALETARSLAAPSSASGAEQQALAKYHARRRLLQQQRQEASDRLRSLGLLPDDGAAACTALARLPEAALTGRLADAREALRAFGPVNKKAAEQHASFSKQGAALEQRLVELEASAKAITDFIRVLDGRKDEALQRTFEQVSEAFTGLFARLVPTGHAAMQLLRSPDAEGALQYTGISLRASFNSTSGSEGLLLPQLSGGQKSLLALALILAIQRTDPAPFYLFDEVDAALDSAHRTALAALLDSMAHPTVEGAEPVQFVCTTFRPEMLQRADRFFGVSFGSRISKVEQITQEQALDFVETEAI